MTYGSITLNLRTSHKVKFGNIFYGKIWWHLQDLSDDNDDVLGCGKSNFQMM